MRVESTRFGSIEPREDQIYTFPEGLPGLTGKHFILIEKTARVFWLQSAEDPAVALLLVDPKLLVPDLAIPSKLEELRPIEPGDGSGLVHRVSVKSGEAPGELTLNLFAPIVLNPSKRLGMQVPLVGSSYGTRQVWPLRPADVKVDEDKNGGGPAE